MATKDTCLPKASSDCNPCVTPSTGDGPIIVECNKYVRVSDIVGVDSVLEPSNNSLLFHGTGAKPVCWKNGSKLDRIRLDQLQGSKGFNFCNLIGQDSSGYWHRIFPDEDKGAQVLVGEGGSIGWKPKNTGNHCFPDDDIVQSTDESPLLAAFTECGPDGQTCLVKLPEGFITSLIPAGENFDADQHAKDLCAGAKSSSTLSTEQLTAKRNLAIICTPDGEVMVIDDVTAVAGGDVHAGLASDTSFVQAAAFGQLAAWSAYNGGAGLITIVAGVITILKAGSYIMNFSCHANPIGGSGTIFVKPFYNGSEDTNGPAFSFVAVASAAPMINWDGSRTFAVGDTVEFKGRFDVGSGGASAGVTNPKMAMLKVS